MVPSNTVPRLGSAFAILQRSYSVNSNNLLHADTVRGWNELEQAMLRITSRPDGPRLLWNEIRLHQPIALIVASLSITSSDDEEGSLTETIARCLVLVYEAAWELVSSKKNVFLDEQELAVLSREILAVVERWWDASLDLIPKWVEARIFNNKTKGYLLVIDAICTTINFPLASSASMNELQGKVVESAKLQDIILTLIALHESTDLKPAKSAIHTLTAVNTLRDLLPETIPTTIPGGALTLSRRVERMLESEVPNVDKTRSPDSITFMEVMSRSNPLKKLLAENGELGMTLARKVWDMREGYPPMWICLEYIISYAEGTEEQCSRRLQTLFNECDFAALIAIALFQWAREDLPQDEATYANKPLRVQWLIAASNKRYMRIKEGLLAFCKRSPTVVRAAFLRLGNYLTVLDQLRANSGVNLEASIRVWEELGEIAGLEESVLRAEAMKARRDAAGGIVGCSWYKCPMYHQESDRVMNWCKGCKRVVYCDYSCADRDWNDGHKDVCGKQGVV